MVHGWGDSHSMPWWDNIERFFCDREHDRDYLQRVDLGSLGTTIGSPKKYARKVRKEAIDLYEKHDQEISIIAHSMGGINSRYFIEFLRGHRIVDNLVTLGSPHQGTYVSYLGYFSSGGRNMTPHCDLIKKMNQKGVHEDVSYTAIWSVNDAIISPSTNARIPPESLKDSDKNIKIKDRGHLRMILSDSLFETSYKDLSKCNIKY